MRLFLFDFFQGFPALIQSARHMETTFPFSSFKRQENLSLPVKVTIPFRIFFILEMIPGIFMDDLKPFQAILRTCQQVSLCH